VSIDVFVRHLPSTTCGVSKASQDAAKHVIKIAGGTVPGGQQSCGTVRVDADSMLRRVTEGPKQRPTNSHCLRSIVVRSSVGSKKIAIMSKRCSHPSCEGEGKVSKLGNEDHSPACQCTIVLTSMRSVGESVDTSNRSVVRRRPTHAGNQGQPSPGCCVKVDATEILHNQRAKQ